MKPLSSENVLLSLPHGQLEILVDFPKQAKGLALICHPHPLFGGANSNKVAFTLARTLRDLDYIALRPNFRGVGKSEGAHDEGEGETADMLAVLEWARKTYAEVTDTTELVLAGFSFGAYVQARVAKVLQDENRAAKRLILVGTAAGHVEGARHYETAAIPRESIVIHGAKDETVPLENVLAWAEPLDQPIIVIPGADHFFHGRLHLLKEIILQNWK